MKTYLALVHKDPNSAYGVSFPDLHGCFSAADDYDQIIANATEALDLWFEDMPEQVARDLEAIRQDCASDLSQGAFILGIPYIRRNTRQKRVNISMDKGTLDAIDHTAKSLSLTRSAFIALAAANEIKGHHIDV